MAQIRHEVCTCLRQSLQRRCQHRLREHALLTVLCSVSLCRLCKVHAHTISMPGRDRILHPKSPLQLQKEQHYISNQNLAASIISFDLRCLPCSVRSSNVIIQKFCALPGAQRLPHPLVIKTTRRLNKGIGHKQVFRRNQTIILLHLESEL